MLWFWPLTHDLENLIQDTTIINVLSNMRTIFPVHYKLLRSQHLYQKELKQKHININ